MLKLKGVSKQGEAFTKVEDLIYFDGPLLSVCVKEDESLVLMLWTDNSDLDNRWCMIPVEKDILTSFLDKELTLKEVIEKNESVIFRDMYLENEKLSDRNVLEVLVKDIPSEYMPCNDSYFYE